MTRPSPLILWLGSAVLGLLGLCLIVLNGAGSAVHWLAPLDTPPAPVNTNSAAPAEPVALQTYSQTWQRPLFNARRQPDPRTSERAENLPSLLKGLTLTGVIASGTVRKAFFKSDDGQQLTATEQQSLANGWRVEHIEAHRVSLTQGTDTQTLILQVLKVPQNPPAPPSIPLPPSSLPENFKDNEQ